ncbi:bifunctional DNA primase/polymerase [Streptomyces antimicrobicus]|uniref:Bifunctional DNA primase/polymerase n=1 Tax=Streptomyces antimicrobicus TaxID=2883108 RepID=A0ABS8AZL7_9ACTN|nr:bifunctional DNA primase/polymerase [Streptomyces antimicrobicus]MCB5177803.1 bifunctional DNA primase/polymerase [Streptomyces antimicrobicus]
MTAYAGPLRIALDLAARGVPVLPLSPDKRPVANCPACRENVCGGRPVMKTPGPCRCLRPCHGWAASTADSGVLTSGAWAAAWRQAGAVGYHPGAGGLTVVDLDSPEAVAWARSALPATRTVSSTRGQHWIYLGAMTSHNGVRPGVDVKSSMAYARWLGPGTGTMTHLPEAVRALVAKQETTPARGRVVSSVPGPATWTRDVATGCRHTDAFNREGLARGLALIAAKRESGAGGQTFGVARFLAARHTGCPGPCGLQQVREQLVAAAVAVGVPESYAERAVTRGFDEARVLERRAAG